MLWQSSKMEQRYDPVAKWRCDTTVTMHASAMTDTAGRGCGSIPPSLQRATHLTVYDDLAATDSHSRE